MGKPSWPVARVCTGIPVPVSIRKFTGIFFHFHYGKGPGRSGIPFRFPDLSGTEFRNVFRKISGTTFRKPGNISKTVSCTSSSPQPTALQCYVKIFMSSSSVVLILFRFPDLSGTEFRNVFRKISGTTFRKPGNISKTVSCTSSSPLYFSVTTTLNYLCRSRLSYSYYL